MQSGIMSKGQANMNSLNSHLSHSKRPIIAEDHYSWPLFGAHYVSSVLLELYFGSIMFGAHFVGVPWLGSILLLDSIVFGSFIFRVLTMGHSV